MNHKNGVNLSYQLKIIVILWLLRLTDSDDTIYSNNKYMLIQYSEASIIGAISNYLIRLHILFNLILHVNT